MMFNIFNDKPAPAPAPEPVMEILHNTVLNPPSDKYIIRIGSKRIGTIHKDDGVWKFTPDTFLPDYLTGSSILITHAFSESETETILNKLKELNQNEQTKTDRDS